MTDSPASYNALAITGTVERIELRTDTLWIRLTSPRTLRNDLTPYKRPAEVRIAQHPPFTVGNKVTGQARYTRVAGENRLHIFELTRIAPAIELI